MKEIVKLKFGSYLHGTTTPSSDIDLKGVYLPSTEDILLQRIKPVISYSKTKPVGEKNNNEDTDFELYSLNKFFSLLTQGESTALEMIFAPPSAIITQDVELWGKIQNIARQILTKNHVSFVYYCRAQANKYGIKGSRVSAARLAYEALKNAEEKYGSQEKLYIIADELRTLCEKNEYLKIIERVLRSEAFFEFCGSKTPFTITLGEARKRAEKMVEAYGQRALAAEQNKGVDWKALSHAVRVANQAIELLKTKHITFPRPEAQHLLDIKLGKLSFQEVSNEIVYLLDRMEKSVKLSTLPERFDQKIVDNFIKECYLSQILNEVI